MLIKFVNFKVWVASIIAEDVAKAMCTLLMYEPVSPLLENSLVTLSTLEGMYATQ